MNETDLLNAVSTYGWSGNGSAENPFIIENLTINGSGTNHCLQLFNLNNYTLIIRNNHFYGTTKTSETYPYNAALVLHYCVNVTISNNTIEDNALVAMSLYRCNATIENNTIRGSRDGINAEFGTYRIRNNTAEDHDYAIHVKGSYLVVMNNTLIGNDGEEGIWISNGPAEVAWNNISGFTQGIETHTDSTSIYHNNTIRNSYYGFQVRGAYEVVRDNTLYDSNLSLWHMNTTVLNNTMIRGGVTFFYQYSGLKYLWGHTIPTSNTANGKPVLYVVEASDVDIRPSDYGQYILVNCTNMTVKDRTFTNLCYITSYFGANLTIEGNKGVVSQPNYWNFRYLGNVTIANNTMKNQSFTLYETSNVKVFNNSVIGVGLGMNTDDTEVSVHNNTIEAHGSTALSLTGHGTDADVRNNQISVVGPRPGDCTVVLKGSFLSLTLEDNTMRGAAISGSWHGLMKSPSDIDLGLSNTLNGRSILFIAEEEGTRAIGPYGQVIVVDSANVTVEGLHMARGDGGVQGLYSSNLVVRSCTFLNLTGLAVYFNECDNITLSSCLFEGGITQASIYRCSSGSDGSPSKVNGNYFINITAELTDSCTLRLAYSNIGEISGNYFKDITGCGLYGREGRADQLSGNEFVNCTWSSFIGTMGAYMAYNNSFIDNGLNTHDSQVWYPSSDSTWDNNSTGNYWSDYEDRYPSATNDGLIWDTPYVIWPDRFEDRYPLVDYTDRIAPLARILHNATTYPNTNTTFRSSSIDNQGIASYNWSFDDGKTWSGSNDAAIHSWSTPGVYNITLRVWDTANLMGQVTSRIEVLDNTRPVAIAGDDVTVDPDTNVTLDASGSTDDLGIVDYRWTYDCGGTTVELAGMVVNVSFDRQGVFVINLTVRDAAGNFGCDDFKVTVVDLTPPVAVIGEDREVPQHTTLDLSGENSTDNWRIESWNWTITSPTSVVTNYNTTGISHTFTEAGEHTVALRVTDAAGLWNETAITVTVLDTTDPVASPGNDVTIDQHDTLRLDGTASWDNVAIVNWTWTIVGPGMDIVRKGPIHNQTFPEAGVFTVMLTVTDGAGNSDSATFSVTVRDTTAPLADAGSDVTVDEGGTVTLDGRGSTDNVGIVWYTWTFEYRGAGVVLSGINPITNTTFAIPGVYTVTLTVLDAEGNEGTDQMTVTVLDITPPSAMAGDDVTVDQHTVVHLDSTGTSDNVGVVDLEWTFEIEGETVTLGGWSPLFTFHEAGVYVVTLHVWDAAGYSASDTVTVTVRDTTPPQPVAGDDVIVDQGDTVDLDGMASSDNVGIVQHKWTFTYDGEEVERTGASVAFTFDAPGVYTVTLTVTDLVGNKATDTLVVTVRDVTSPVAKAGDDVTVDQHTTVTFDGSASSDNVGVVDFKWTLTYDGEPRELAGATSEITFDLAGEYVVSLTVTDGRGNIATDTMTVTVMDTEPPVAYADSDVTIAEGDAFLFNGSACTDNVGVVSWKWTFVYNGTQEELEGEAAYYAFHVAGSYTVTLEVSDARGNTAEDTMAVTVKAPPASEEPEPEDDGGLSVAVLVVVLAVVAAAVLVAVVLWLRRRE